MARYDLYTTISCSDVHLVQLAFGVGRVTMIVPVALNLAMNETPASGGMICEQALMCYSSQVKNFWFNVGELSRIYAR